MTVGLGRRLAHRPLGRFLFLLFQIIIEKWQFLASFFGKNFRVGNICHLFIYILIG
jgi:hypothetical protein